MKLTYEKIQEFIENYCKDYSLYANDADTMEKMDEYWLPELTVTAYFHRENGDYPIVYSSRKEFQDFLVKSHQNIIDSMNPREIIIDVKKKKVVIQSVIEKTNRKTKEKIAIDGMGCYHLEADENNNLKIKGFDFIWDAPSSIKNLGT